MKIQVKEYLFDKIAKTVTFTNYPAIDLDSMLLITNVTKGIIIFNFADATKKGTVSGNIITLSYDTSSMDNSDDLQIFYEDQEQLSISMAMDKANGTPLQVQLPKDLKQDQEGALILSDMKGPLYWESSNSSQPLIIDCKGFSSVLLHKLTTAGTVTITGSNDGINYTAAYATNYITAFSSAVATLGLYQIPVYSRYIKLTGNAVSISCVIYLNNTSSSAVTATLSYVNGYAIQTAGNLGAISVGGQNAPTIAPTTNPLRIGTVDASAIPLTRATLSDELGRIQIGTHSQQRLKGVNTLGFDPVYRNVLEVQDTTQIEGNSQGEILLRILTELKILNLQITQLPYLIDRGLESEDDISNYRNDPTILTQ